jgi:AcrR family transcriptional regulator
MSAAGDSEGEGGERQMLIEAAISIAAVRGFADTTPQMIAERAGLDPEAFQRHFDGLEPCFLAAWDSLRDNYLSRIDAVIGREEGWRDEIRALARETTGCSADSPGEARLLALEVMELGPRGRERLDGLLDRLAALVDGGREGAASPERIPATTAEGVVGGVHHRLMRELRSPEPTPPGRLAAEFAAFAVTPYLGVQAGLEELDRSQ